MTAPSRGRFVLVDRDGTINEEVGHLDDPDRAAADPRRGQRDPAPAIGRPRRRSRHEPGQRRPRAAWRRGRSSAIHDRCRRCSTRKARTSTRSCICPHAPDDACALPQARAGHGARGRRAVRLRPGPRLRDRRPRGRRGLGRAIGATTFLVLTGHGVEERPGVDRDGLADHVVPDLGAAADIIATLVERGGPVTNDDRDAVRAYLRESVGDLASCVEAGASTRSWPPRTLATRLGAGRRQAADLRQRRQRRRRPAPRNRVREHPHHRQPAALDPRDRAHDRHLAAHRHRERLRRRGRLRPAGGVARGEPATC